MNTYPIRELMSEESSQTLQIALINARKANPFFARIINNKAITEIEFQYSLEVHAI